MDDDGRELMKETWKAVGPIAPKVAARFYERLFAVLPEARAMFGDDLREQERKLMETIGTVVVGAEEMAKHVPGIEELGRRHAGYGVEPADYAPVADCLIAAFHETLGERFTAPMEQAWREGLTTLSATMISAEGRPAG